MRTYDCVLAGGCERLIDGAITPWTQVHQHGAAGSFICTHTHTHVPYFQSENLSVCADSADKCAAKVRCKCSRRRSARQAIMAEMCACVWLRPSQSSIDITHANYTLIFPRGSGRTCQQYTYMYMWHVCGKWQVAGVRAVYTKAGSTLRWGFREREPWPRETEIFCYRF